MRLLPITNAMKIDLKGIWLPIARPFHLAHENATSNSTFPLAWSWLYAASGCTATEVTG